MATVTKPIILDETGQQIVSAIQEVANRISNKGICYGFHIDGAEDVPNAKITYIADAVGMIPAKMDYDADKFNYGSWKNAFFMPKPCMLKTNGVVDYYLDPEDFTKKADGTASDIADVNYDGNAMIEWGQNGKKIWWKVVPDTNDEYSADVYIADYKVDEGFVDWNFHNYTGTSSNHFYTPIYNGSLDSNNKLRSLSGKNLIASKTATQEESYAEANNPASTPIYTIDQYVDITLITFLHWLIGCSTDSQTVFGKGIESGGQATAEAYTTGALNTKGMFYGSNNSTTAVKTFGRENPWALQWQRIIGWLMVDGVQKVKLTYGQEDGSTQNGFDFTGSGYISKSTIPTGTSGQYLYQQSFNKDGIFPKNADSNNASASKYYCDGFWFNNSGTRVPFRGGYSANGAYCGVSSADLHFDASLAAWGFGATLSCKPLS